MIKRGVILLVIFIFSSFCYASEISIVEPLITVKKILNESSRNYDLTFDNESIIINSMNLFFVKSIQTEVIIEQSKNNFLPVGAGTSLFFINIKGDKLDSVAKAEIVFKIKKELIEEDISVKYYDGYWKEIAFDELSDDLVYRYFKITTNRLGYLAIVKKPILINYNLDEPKIVYKVNKEFIKKNNLDDDQIVLSYYDNSWKKLNTTKTGEKGSFVFYESCIEPSMFSLIKGQTNRNNNLYLGYYKIWFYLIFAFVLGFYLHYYYSENLHLIKSKIHEYYANINIKQAKSHFSKAKNQLYLQNIKESRKYYNLAKQYHQDHKKHHKISHLMNAEHHKKLANLHKRKIEQFQISKDIKKENHHQKKMNEHLNKSLFHYKEANKL